MNVVRENIPGDNNVIETGDQLCDVFTRYFAAEQRNSLGKVWHPGCLRCEECGKRLNPGQHSEVGSPKQLAIGLKRGSRRLQEMGNWETHDKT